LPDGLVGHGRASVSHPGRAGLHGRPGRAAFICTYY